MLCGFLLLAVVLVVAGCGGQVSPTPAPTLTPATPAATPGQANVNIAGLAFVPDKLTVAVGTKVTWTNNDSVTHTVTSDDGLFESGNLSRGATFSHTFNQKGTFDYYCRIHPSMTAQIIVE